jgi:hypothetical protein
VGKAVGADIDYIINAQQLAAYMAAITDALWNRLIRDGVNGLAGLSTDNAPEGGFLKDNTGCDSLGTPNLVGACEGYLSSNGGNFSISRDKLLADIRAIRDDLTALRPALLAWQAVADELKTFITTESETSSATCISNALTPYFPDPTLAGVTAYAASISTQIQTIDARITLLNEYEGDVLGLNPNNWSSFVVTAQNIQTQLPTLRVPEDAIERADIQRADLDAAFEQDIRSDILLCH